MRLQVPFTLICALIYANTFGQDAVVSNGGDASGSGGSSSYTIGQTVVSGGSGSGVAVDAGVQQPFEIFVLVGVEELDIDLSISVHPNPTTAYLTISTKTFREKSYTYVLSDSKGTLISSSSINSEMVSIDMQNLSASFYFLTVSSGQKAIKTFKIIKK